MKAIVLVAFGSTYINGIEESIDLLKKELEDNFKDYTIMTSFTSNKIISLLKQRYDYFVPHISTTLFNMVNDGYDQVCLVPLHAIEGEQFKQLIKVQQEYEYSFKKLILLKPLFSYKTNNSKSLYSIVDALKNDMEDGNILLVGHGSVNDYTGIYDEIKTEFVNELGKRFYLATLEGENTFKKAVEIIVKDKISEITIKTLLMIPGKHYICDICGEKNSLITMLKDKGIKVKISQASLLQYSHIRKIYINNIKHEIYMNNIKHEIYMNNIEINNGE